MYTAVVDAGLHDGGTVRASFRVASEDEAREAAEQFVRVNEPLIEAAAVTVTDHANGRFDNALFEDIADIIYERSGLEQDEIDQKIRDADEQELWDAAIGPAIDRVMEMTNIDWAGA